MTKELKKREQVPPERKWSVELIYGSEADWEEDFAATAEFPERISKWSGRLSESPASLKKAIEELLQQRRTMEKLMTYASMKKDEDLSSSTHSGMASRIMSRMVEVSAASSFFTPELLAIPGDRMAEWLDSDTLKPYRTWLENILRYRSHTLSKKEENLLAKTGEIVSGFGNAFGKLSNVDMPARYPMVKDEEGKNVKLTNGNYIA
ncbi:MAG: oligoendopeptidase F, partial [Candidatus Aegiribacteria sp.]|nr:oligoendopeptidase F [Candidatus Aegiribacteria sp.]